MKFYKKSVITRGDNIPYLVRYSLFSCRLFAIKIHHILISDDDCLHDHPWAFITFLLSAGYCETFIDNERTKFYYRPRFSLLYRKAEFKHSLFLTKPVWTFVITFKKVREWGFWNSKGFTPWYKWVSSDRRCE
jgi:hypothetical protein